MFTKNGNHSKKQYYCISSDEYDIDLIIDKEDSELEYVHIFANDVFNFPHIVEREC